MLQPRTIGGSIYRVSAGGGGRVWGGSAEAEGERTEGVARRRARGWSGHGSAQGGGDGAGGVLREEGTGGDGGAEAR